MTNGPLVVIYCVVLSSRLVSGMGMIHQENMSVTYIPLYTPLLYGKSEIYRSIPMFLIYDPKYRLWVPTINVLSKILNKNNFSNKIFKFYG